MLRGVVVDAGREPDHRTPHFQIILESEGERWRCPVNVRSRRKADTPEASEVLFSIIQRFVHPVTAELEQLPDGFTPLGADRPELALDYVRSNLFDPAMMRHLPAHRPGEDDDLQDALELLVRELRRAPGAELFVFGEAFSDTRPQPEDRTYRTTRGIHNIHMNQGNPLGHHRRDNAVFRDGGLVLHFPARPPSLRWKAVFLAFQSQSFHTDDTTGDPLGREVIRRARQEKATVEPASAGQTESPLVSVRIAAALVNPGPGFPESVTLLNTLDCPVALDGWSLADQNGGTEALAGRIEAGQTVVITLSGTGTTLGNRGGLITLLNADGIKVHGVAYTKVPRGRTITF